MKKCNSDSALWLCVVIFLLAFLLSIIWQCQNVDYQNDACLAFLNPLLQLFVLVGQVIEPWIQKFYWLVPLPIMVILGFTVYKSSFREQIWFSGLAIFIVAQLCFIYRQVTMGMLLYLGATLFLWGYYWRVKKSDVSLSCIQESTNRHFEKVIFLWLIVFSVITRFFFLNRIPSTWTGEITAHIAISTNLSKAIPVSLGMADFPVISQGFLWSLVHYVVNTLMGTSWLNMKMIYATGSIVLLVILYGFLRRVFGNVTAIVGTAFLSFAPFELGWARSEYFFQLSNIYMVVTAMITFFAFEKQKRWIWLLLASLMGFSVFLYPSGMLIFMVPLITGIVLFFNPSEKSKYNLGHKHLFILFYGAALWLLLPSFVYSLSSATLQWVSPHQAHYLNGGNLLRRLGETNHLAADSPLFSIVRIVFGNTQLFLKELFVEANQNWTIDFANLSPQTLLPASFVLFIPLGIVGLVFYENRLHIKCIIALWMVFTWTCGAFSYDYASRRFSGMLLVLIILGAIGLSKSFYLMSRIFKGRKGFKWLPSGLLLLTIIVQGIIQISTYFRSHLSGIDPSTAIARKVASLFEPNALVIMVLPTDPWLPGKVIYQLLADLKSTAHPIALVDASFPPDRTTQFLSNPVPDFAQWFYQLTFLNHKASKWKATHCPWNTIFVLRNDPSLENDISKLSNQNSESQIERITICEDVPLCNYVIIKNNSLNQNCVQNTESS
ncbi:MAG: hypothetical protein KDD48_01605 [Bdellovibrionales bacterium]|nr:hypothetical protein [Bdellovibrionales bacterium]